jgi:hypothetical protein
MMTRMVTICLILFASPAVAWDRADTQRQAAYFVLHAIDWGQTLDISHDCRSGFNRWEHNPILGTCPDRGEVNAYFLGTAVAHYVIARSLSPEWRRRFQYVTIGFQAGTVASNFKIGLQVRF